MPESGGHLSANRMPCSKDNKDWERSGCIEESNKRKHCGADKGSAANRQRGLSSRCRNGLLSVLPATSESHH